ncbi:MAG: SDR family NAD(P)-dependent oxidoreductase [Planctomycetota bacterium]
MTERRVLITGANGFIGSHCAERFRRAGWSVRGLVRATSDRSLLAGIPVEFVVGDVTDAASLVPAFADVDTIVHVAGLAADWGPWQQFVAVNLHGTQHVARAAADAKVRRFVHVSTSSLHGFAGARRMTETSPMPPSRFAYVETKRQAEAWLWQFAAASRMAVTAVRPGNVFGPRDHTFLAKYVAAIRKGQGGYIGGGRAWTCPTYVENLADAILLAAEHPAAVGEAFLITDGLDIDWRTFTEALCRHLDLRAPRLSLPYWLGYAVAVAMEATCGLLRTTKAPLLTRYRIGNGGRDYHFAIDKARTRLGFEPAVGLDEALRRSAAWLQACATRGPGVSRT